jgi:hypothetical protein
MKRMRLIVVMLSMALSISCLKDTRIFLRSGVFHIRKALRLVLVEKAVFLAPEEGILI